MSLPETCRKCGAKIEGGEDSGHGAILIIGAGIRAQIIPVDSEYDWDPEFAVCRKCLVEAMKAPEFESEEEEEAEEEEAEEEDED